MGILKHLLKGSRGFSLPELMMAAAILGGLSLGFMKLTQNGTESNKRIESGSQIEELRKEILGIMSNRDACKNTFTLYQDFSDVVGGTAKSIPSIRDKNNTIRFSAPQQFNGGTKLKSLRVSNYNPATKTARLFIGFDYMLNSKTTVDRMKGIDLQLELDATNKLVSCVAMAGVQNVDPKQLCDTVVGFDTLGRSYFQSGECQFAQASCEKLKKIWDPATSTCNFNGEKYTYPKTCSMTFSHSDNGGAYRSATLDMSSGGLIGVRLRGDVNSDDRFTISSSCGTADKLDAYIKNCYIGFGWKDSTNNTSSANAYPNPLKAYDALVGSSLTLQTGGNVNDDDSFYIRMRCPNGSEPDLNTYVKNECQICFGHVDVYQTTPTNVICKKVQDTSDGTWARLMTIGDVSDDDAFFLGFFCRREYSPDVKQWSF